MQQFLSVWVALDGRKRNVVMLSSIAMFAAIIGLARLATAPNLVTLYSGLDSSSAGEVVKSLEQQGVVFEVKNGSIYVPSTMRDQLRMSLASDGLPATSNQGYELLDDISGFGTTAQMFDAAYWRAKEGELARTIIASPLFQSARVHISNPSKQTFRSSQNPTASVTVTGAGNGISSTQARALRHLVSSAVAGMETADVSVIDGRNGTVVQADAQGENATDSTDLENRLRNNVVRLLEARVGQGNAVVEVSIEANSESESITERTFDPDSRVAISTKKEESSNSSNGTTAGSVTIASNLPEGDASGAGNENSSQTTESSETTNFEVSETTREIVRSAGSLKRVSVAALVDGIYEIDPASNETTWVPRSENELDAFRELIESAIGFDESRGDKLTIKSLQFQVPDLLEQGEERAFLSSLNLDVMRLVQVAVLALVSLVLGLFVLRPALSQEPIAVFNANAETARLPGPAPSPSKISESSAPANSDVLTGEIDDGRQTAAGFAAIQSNSQSGAVSVLGSIPNNPVEHLQDMISDRQGETVEILRNWIDNREEQV